MLITIDTNEQTVEVLNEDTKDWEPAYLNSLQYNANADSLVMLNFEIALPHGMK